jgi:hypothetical protein
MSLLPDLGENKDPDMWMRKELTTSEVMLCVAYLEGVAVRRLMATPRVMGDMIREYMVEWTQGTETTRVEFTEAVNRVLTGRWGV